jgi:hypothetical protein
MRRAILWRGVSPASPTLLALGLSKTFGLLMFPSVVPSLESIREERKGDPEEEIIIPPLS